MTLDDLLAQLATNFNLPPLLPDAEGWHRVSFDEVHLAIRADGPALCVHSDIGNIDPDDPDLCAAVLGANFFGDGPGGAGLALDEFGQLVLIRRALLEPLDYGAFVTLLERTVNYAEYWQKRLATPASTPPPASSGGINYDLMRV